MSIASAPSQHALEIATYGSDSPFKKALLSPELKARVWLGEPLGGLNFNPDAPAVFIAFGIGVTPFRSILADHSSAGGSEMTFVYIDRSGREIPFEDELNELAINRPELKLTYVVGEGAKPDRHVQASFDQSFLSQFVADPRDMTNYYVVGSPKSVLQVKEWLAALGVAPARIRSDI